MIDLHDNGHGSDERRLLNLSFCDDIRKTIITMNVFCMQCIHLYGFANIFECLMILFAHVICEQPLFQYLTLKILQRKAYAPVIVPHPIPSSD